MAIKMPSTICEMPAYSFQDALVKLVPSISVQTTAMGTTLYVNGLPDKYLLVLINGKKVAGDISGSIDYDRINMDAVKTY